MSTEKSMRYLLVCSHLGHTPPPKEYQFLQVEEKAVVWVQTKMFFLISVGDLVFGNLFHPTGSDIFEGTFIHWTAADCCLARLRPHEGSSVPARTPECEILSHSRLSSAVSSYRSQPFTPSDCFPLELWPRRIVRWRQSVQRCSCKRWVPFLIPSNSCVRHWQGTISYTF